MLLPMLLPLWVVLDVNFNNFTDTVPESIYSCSNLTALRESGNHIDEQLSPRIGNLKYLTFLSLADNSFRNITNALRIIKSCRNLTTLLLGQNFSGELMPEDDTLDGFQKLQLLSIDDCSLLGNSNNTDEYAYQHMLKSETAGAHLNPSVFRLPIYKGSLQYRKSIAFTKVLDLSNNKLTGEIPLGIGQLKYLLSLNLSFNDLTGQIPMSVCNLTNLLVLDFSSNNLTGAIPAA